MPELKIYGEISPGMAAEVKATLEAAADGEELVVRIDSEGGSVFEGFSIYDAIAGYPGPKRSVIESAAFSIASLIALACDEVEITSNGYMMIHNPYAMVEGDDEVLARKSDLLSKLKATMAKVYQQRTGRSETDVLQMMRQESFFDAQEAKAAGLVDTVLARRRETVAKITDVKRLPECVVAALWNGGRTEEQPEPKEEPHMSEPTAAVKPTVAQIKVAYPVATSEFIVKAMEEEMSMEEIATAYVRGMEEKLAAMEEENEALKASVAAQETPEEEPEEEQEEAAAKAKSGVAPVAQASEPTRSATVKWREAVAKYVAAGHPKSKAVTMANRANPGLRAEMLQEVNV